MNLFELSWGLSCVAGLVGGIVSGAKAGAVGLLIGVPLGLVIGVGCYFAWMGLSVLILKASRLGETEESTWFQNCAASIALGTAILAPIASGIVALVATRSLLS